MTTTPTATPDEYPYTDARANASHGYLIPALVRALETERARRGPTTDRVFDLGCGNGCVAAEVSKIGFRVSGADPSHEGIQQANGAYPGLELRVGSAYDDLASAFGRFPLLYSLEVVEHVYYPRKFAATAYSLLEPGGLAIISTPYNGYLKNLAVALAGGFDRHATALWDHGHIKFWSRKTLAALLAEAGFSDTHFIRVGRVPPLAKSMVAIARRPA